jgi:hypothetical protein
MFQDLQVISPEKRLPLILRQDHALKDVLERQSEELRQALSAWQGLGIAGQLRGMYKALHDCISGLLQPETWRNRIRSFFTEVDEEGRIDSIHGRLTALQAQSESYIASLRRNIESHQLALGTYRTWMSGLPELVTSLGDQDRSGMTALIQQSAEYMEAQLQTAKASALHLEQVLSMAMESSQIALLAKTLARNFRSATTLLQTGFQDEQRLLAQHR